MLPLAASSLHVHDVPVSSADKDILKRNTSLKEQDGDAVSICGIARYLLEMFSGRGFCSRCQFVYSGALLLPVKLSAR